MYAFGRWKLTNKYMEIIPFCLSCIFLILFEYLCDFGFSLIAAPSNQQKTFVFLALFVFFFFSSSFWLNRVRCIRNLFNKALCIFFFSHRHLCVSVKLEMFSFPIFLSFFFFFRIYIFSDVSRVKVKIVEEHIERIAHAGKIEEKKNERATRK